MISEEADSPPPRRTFKRTYSFKFKAVLVAALFLAFLLYRLLFPQPQPTCINDNWQNLTHGLNRDLVADPEAGSAFEGNSKQLSTGGKAFIAIGSLLMDIWVGVLGVNWLVRINNLRGFVALGLFFITRGTIFLNVCRFPFPGDMAWRSPGVFTLVVPYDHTRDFFQSGHTGTLTMIFLQLWTLRMRWVAALCAVSFVYEVNVLVTCRTHYSIDIVGGAVWGCFWFWLVERYCKWVDKLFSLPMMVGEWVYRNHCVEEETEEEGGEEVKGNDGVGRGTERESKGSDNIELVEVGEQEGSSKSDELSGELEM